MIKKASMLVGNNVGILETYLIFISINKKS